MILKTTIIGVHIVTVIQPTEYVEEFYSVSLSSFLKNDRFIQEIKEVELGTCNQSSSKI